MMAEGSSTAGAISEFAASMLNSMGLSAERLDRGEQTSSSRSPRASCNSTSTAVTVADHRRWRGGTRGAAGSPPPPHQTVQRVRARRRAAARSGAGRDRRALAGRSTSLLAAGEPVPPRFGCRRRLGVRARGPGGVGAGAGEALRRRCRARTTSACGRTSPRGPLIVAVADGVSGAPRARPSGWRWRCAHATAAVAAPDSTPALRDLVLEDGVRSVRLGAGRRAARRRPRHARGPRCGGDASRRRSSSLRFPPARCAAPRVRVAAVVVRRPLVLRPRRSRPCIGGELGDEDLLGGAVKRSRVTPARATAAEGELGRPAAVLLLAHRWPGAAARRGGGEVGRDVRPRARACHRR